MVAQQIGTIVGAEEVAQIEAALASASRARNQRDDARAKLEVERFGNLQAEVTRLANHVATANGSVGKLAVRLGQVEEDLAHLDGEKTGKAIAATLFWKLVFAGIALVGAAAGIGAWASAASN